MEKKRFFRKCLLALIAGFILMGNMFAQQSGAGVYGGGPFYKEGNTVINELRSSGFTWVCVWTIHIEANGDLGFNGEFNLVQNGTYVGNSTYPNFPADMAQLKTAPTSINWVEFGLSGWGSGTFNAVKSFVNSEGTGPGSTLYENFKALRDAIPAIDAFSFDDEDTYDEPSSTQFAIMLADLGFKVSICPYTRVSHWQNLVANTNSARPGTIEDVHLQCYAGGSGNNPCTWDGYFASEINVMPGVEDGGGIAGSMSNWNNQCGINGGWLWLYDDFYGNASTVQSYAAAINNNVTQVTTDPPGQASNPSPTNDNTGVSTSSTLSWNSGNGATSHNVYFGTSNPPASIGNQANATYNPGVLNTNTTYYWKIDEVNSHGTTAGAVWSFTTSSTTEVEHTDPVGTGTITARAEINSNESASHAFDNLYTSGTQNSTWSKWLDNGGTPSISEPCWIQIQLPAAVTVNKLAIVSANDDFGRDPEDFNLQGSNDGANWTTLGSWSSQTFSSRYQRREFSITNTSTYNYYRLNITKNDDDVSLTQLCEIELYGPEGSTAVLPGLASNPNPANGATGVSLTADLSWTAGSGATSHGVYFGTVATPGSNEFKDFHSGATFDPGTLAENTTYYWRVDEINDVGTSTGTVWSFTTLSITEVEHTDPVGTGAITARAEINSNESASRAFDNLHTSGTQNSTWSKWLDNGGIPSTSNPSWIQIQLPNAVIVNKLGIISANDDFGRDPEDFNLQGSNDGANWTTLGSWSSQTFSSRFQSREFTFTNTATYNYYRLNITKNDEDVSMTQLCEIELYGPEGAGFKLKKESSNQVKNIEAYGLKIYPNPFDETIKVNAIVPIRRVSLLNLQGKIIHEREMNSKVKEFTFDNLQEGLYFFKVEYTDGIKEIRKMIKK